jgi:hypothetical protein
VDSQLGECIFAKTRANWAARLVDVGKCLASAHWCPVLSRGETHSGTESNFSTDWSYGCSLVLHQKMTVGFPSDRGLQVTAALRTLAILVCAIAQAIAAGPAYPQGLGRRAGDAKEQDRAETNTRSGLVHPSAVRATPPFRLPNHSLAGRAEATFDPKAADGETSKLLNLGLLDEVARLLSLLPPWKTVGEGEPLALSIEADLILVSLQWFFNGQPIPGETRSVLNLQSVQAANAGRYQLRASLLGITLLSLPTDVQINETDGTVDRNVAAFDDFNAAATHIQKRSAKRGSAKSATARGFSGTQVFSTVGASNEPGEPVHCGVPGGSSEWFAWQVPTNGTALITTDGSNFDTVLAVYIGPGDSYATLTNVACDNDGGANGKTSRVTFLAQAGTIYYIAVDGVNGARGKVKLNYSIGASPTITAQPESQTAAFGKSATLSVAAIASPSARYQWTFNGAILPNATNATLTLANVAAINLGAYQVCVTNTIGGVWSARADLLPEAPLHFSSRRATPEGFHLSVYGPAGASYVIDCSTNLSNWMPIHTNTSGTGLFDYLHPSTPPGAAFYRVRSTP